MKTEINYQFDILVKALKDVKKHIEDTEHDYNYNGLIVPKTDLLKYIDLTINENAELKYFDNNMNVIKSIRITKTEGVPRDVKNIIEFMGIRSYYIPKKRQQTVNSANL